MKKTYINPELEVVKVQTQQMLAVSARPFENTDASTDGGGDYEDARFNDGYDW